MDTQVSPISQLLHSLGMTREDLNKRSNEMRQFLTANDSTPTRAPEHTSGYRSRSGSDLHQESRSASSSFSLTRSVSAASTSSKREMSPPSTPVKTEQSEGALPSRAMDSMEIIIERQRQSRKGRKSRREKDRAAPGKSFVPPPSPSPSSTSASAMSLDSFMQARDDRPLSAAGSEATSATTSSEMTDPPPVTPQKSKYYREHTMNMSNGSTRKDVACKTETPTPTKPPTRQPSLGHPQAAFYGYPPFATYGQYVPTHYPIPQASTSLLPVTPQTSRIMNPPAISTAGRKIASPLPPSPLVASSSPPSSSPAPHHVNLVSSPGPMASSPVKDHDRLPFKLPPGPYSPKKPDLSYAALVGQAILASADHRLTLQEIYDFITIVYPHYKRGETTWMNSIRHVLSTTACFRKVPRDRSIGRTLWAIYDEDLECFKGGGFKKQLCKDIMKQQAEKDKKNKARKRSDVEEDDAPDSRKPKKAKKDFKVTSSMTMTSETTSVSQVPILNPQPSFLVAGTSSHPFFPRPTPHHQPYYESCIPQPQLLPAEVIFPPLPPTAALASRAASSAASDKSKEPTPPPPIEKTISTSTNASMTSLSSSLTMPELTPNRSSSNSPPSSVLASDMDVDISNAPTANAKASGSNGVAIVGVDIQGDDGPPSSLSVDDDNVFNSSLLGPVSFWGESPGTTSLLQPAVELLNFDAMASDDEDEAGDNEKTAAAFKNYLYRPLSPTPRSRSKASSSSQPPPLALKSRERPTTPDNARASTSTVLPSTPPRRVKLSSVRTPISHKGLHMSPSASLAHYKSNLDPPRPERLDAPPVLLSSIKATEGEGSSSAQDDVFDPLRTPRRRSTTQGASHVTLAGPFPQTPTRDTPSAYDSIFRTPTGTSSFSPFRTPSSRSVLDPNDPRVLLDDELNRQSQLVHDSPGGIFGKGSKLLYDSPGFGDWSSSPGKKYWW